MGFAYPHDDGEGGMSHAWMPFYVADYLADTRHLSTFEHGAYLLLIMHYWQTGGLPRDEVQLCRITGMSSVEWKRSSPTLAIFFSADWFHKRIDAELAKADVKHSRRAEAGKRGGNASVLSKQKSSNATSNAQASSSQSESERKKDAEAIASGANAPLDPVELCWREGVPTLTAMGATDRDARANVGRWLRDTKSDGGRVLGAIHRARDHGSRDPIPLVGRLLNPLGKSNGTNKSTAAVARRIAEEIREAERMEMPESGCGGTNYGPPRLLSPR